LIYNMEYTALYAGMRFMDFGIVLGFLYMAWIMFRNKGEGRLPLAPVFGYGGLLLLFIYSTLELNTMLHWLLPRFKAGGISILWSLFAISFVSIGIWKNIRGLRYSGLVIFMIVVGKVFIVDLALMQLIYRVLAFMVVGILLILGAFAYIYANKKFIQPASVVNDEKESKET